MEYNTGIADGEIEELERLEAEATPGKWVCEYSIDDQRSNSLGEESMIRVDGSDPGSANGLVVGTIYYDGIVLAMTENDGYFIVAMRNHLKPLIHRLKRAEAENVRLRSALEPFADMANSRFEGTADDESIYVMLSIDVASICKTARFGNIHSATVGDLRRAAAALADAGKGGGE